MVLSFYAFSQKSKLFCYERDEGKRAVKKFWKTSPWPRLWRTDFIQKKKEKNAFVASVEGFLRTLSKLFLHLSLYMIIIFMVFLVPITYFFRGKFL